MLKVGLRLWEVIVQIASCGHTLKEDEDGHPVAIKGYTREDKRCVNYVTMCNDCFLQYSVDYVDCLLNTEDEQFNWVVGK